ncbi:MAG TPA: ribosome silencing factor [Alphaproteobacteria bacterium]|nr:ribosome silencing factor [Alphaproteobacteria bacterium]
MTIIPAPKKTKAAQKSTAKKAASKKAAPKKPVKKAVAKKTAPAKKVVAKKVAAKTSAKKTAAKKSAVKKAVAKKVVAKKAAAKKVVAPKKAALKTSAPAKKPVANKTVAPKAAAPKVSAPKKPAKPLSPVEQLLAQVTQILEDGKAEDIVAIDMTGKSAIADYMVVATGRSQRQLAALAEHLRAQLKLGGRRLPQPEGLGQGDWVLLDVGDIIVHLFRPEVRGEYNLEKMWSQPFGAEPTGMEGMVKDHAVPTPHAERMAEQQVKTFRPDFRGRNSHKPRRR